MHKSGHGRYAHKLSKSLDHIKNSQKYLLGFYILFFRGVSLLQRLSDKHKRLIRALTAFFKTHKTKKNNKKRK